MNLQFFKYSSIVFL